MQSYKSLRQGNGSEWSGIRGRTGVRRNFYTALCEFRFEIEERKKKVTFSSAFLPTSKKQIDLHFSVRLFASHFDLNENGRRRRFSGLEKGPIKRAEGNNENKCSLKGVRRNCYTTLCVLSSELEEKRKKFLFPWHFFPHRKSKLIFISLSGVLHRISIRMKMVGGGGFSGWKRGQ